MILADILKPFYQAFLLIVQNLEKGSLHQKIPYIYALTASFGFVFTGLLIKMVPEVKTCQIIFIRSITALLINSLTISLGSFQVYPQENQTMSVILKRGIYGMFALAFFFYGLRYTSLSEAQVLVMTSPFLTGIFSSIKLNENYTKTQFISTIIGFLGISFIVKPPIIRKWFNIPTNELVEEIYLIGYLLCFISAIFRSLVQVTVKESKQKNTPTVILMQYLLVFQLFFSVLAQFQEGIGSISYGDYIICIWIGIIGHFAQIVSDRSFQLGITNNIAILGYSQVLFAVLFDIIFLKSKPHFTTFIGISLVFVGGFIIFNKTCIKNEPLLPNSITLSRAPGEKLEQPIKNSESPQINASLDQNNIQFITDQNQKGKKQSKHQIQLALDPIKPENENPLEIQNYRDNKKYAEVQKVLSIENLSENPKLKTEPPRKKEKKTK